MASTTCPMFQTSGSKPQLMTNVRVGVVTFIAEMSEFRRSTVQMDLQNKVSKYSNYVHYFLHYEIENYDQIVGKCTSALRVDRKL